MTRFSEIVKFKVIAPSAPGSSNFNYANYSVASNPDCHMYHCTLTLFITRSLALNIIRSCSRSQKLRDDTPFSCCTGV